MLRRLLCLSLACLLMVASVAEAPLLAQTSGGYGRPSAGSGYSSAARRPSTSFGGSGGYRRPSTSSSYGGFSGSQGAGDQAISRRSSADALRAYQSGQAPAVPSRRPSAYGADGGQGAGGSPYQGGGYGWQPSRRPPPSAYGPAYAASDQRFGAFSGLFLFGLLNALSQPRNAAFFRDNQNDPGYRQWRTAMDQAAAQDPAVRDKLAALDATLAQSPAAAGKPAPLSAGPAQAAPRRESPVIVIVVLAVGIGLFAFFWLRRRRAAAPAAPAAPKALGGSAETRFRVGMTLPIDPSAFILAGGAAKVTPPSATGGMVSVEAVGVLMDGAIPLHRLYMPGGDSFLQLHLGADGRPDECRYFSRLDSVTPADAQEWALWLDPAQGMIGWPQFQTKDGKLYDRVWSPGSSRIAPRPLSETVRDLRGTTARKLQAMLYGAATGAPAPAPPTEYVLVAAVDAGEQAFVEVHAGIDINPAAITLPAVPLT